MRVLRRSRLELDSADILTQTVVDIAALCHHIRSVVVIRSTELTLSGGSELVVSDNCDVVIGRTACWSDMHTHFDMFEELLTVRVGCTAQCINLEITVHYRVVTIGAPFPVRKIGAALSQSVVHFAHFSGSRTIIAGIGENRSIFNINTRAARVIRPSDFRTLTMFVVDPVHVVGAHHFSVCRHEVGTSSPDRIRRPRVSGHRSIKH